MELSFDLVPTEDLESSVDIVENNYKSLSEFDIVPTSGVLLGLDISERSSGVCLYENGKKVTGNISLSVDDMDTFREVKLRRELKHELSSLISGKTLDIIVIEDAYQGINPKTTRALYALNTAIDEMILDGECYCKEFVRVPNTSWKSWLYSLDVEDKFSGLKDKARIEACLSLIGIIDSGVGYQDRLDATGMVIGYLLKGKLNASKRLKVSTTDIISTHEEDEEFICETARYNLDVEDLNIRVIDFGNRIITKKELVSYVSMFPESVFISSKPVVLGASAERLGVISNCREGYFGFWLSKRARRKAGIL